MTVSGQEKAALPNPGTGLGSGAVTRTAMTGTAPSFLRPAAIERGLGRVLAGLVWIGLVRGHFYVLEIRGRKSGKTIAFPVDPLDLDGRRYLVCPRGDSNWVRNVRAVGEVTLAHALRRRRSRARPRNATPAICGPRTFR